MIAPSLTDQIRLRARRRCEYCHMPEEFDPLPFQIDHIVPLKHLGPTVFENLAFACCECNNHKGCNLAGINPRTGRVVRLFNPRRDAWRRHFEWYGALLVGKTPTGIATVNVLEVNLPYRVLFRKVLMMSGDSWT